MLQVPALSILLPLNEWDIAHTLEWNRFQTWIHQIPVRTSSCSSWSTPAKCVSRTLKAKIWNIEMWAYQRTSQMQCMYMCYICTYMVQWYFVHAVIFIQVQREVSRFALWSRHHLVTKMLVLCRTYLTMACLFFQYAMASSLVPCSIWLVMVGGLGLGLSKAS